MVVFNDLVNPPGGDDPPPDSPGAAANMLSAMVDGITEQHELVASVQARIAVQMCEALRFALNNDRIFVRDETSTSSSREEWTRRALIAEFAAAFRLSERKVASMLATSEALATELPETLRALRDGQISLQHAETLVSQSVGLDPAQRLRFESEAIVAAMETSPPQFKRAAIDIRERLNPETAADRKAEAMECRYVQVNPCADGMASMEIYGPAEVLLSVENAARQTARSLRSAGDERTRAQIATDAVLDAIVEGFTAGQPSLEARASADERDPDVGVDGIERPAANATNGSPSSTASRIRPTVHVTVPVMTLLGHSSEPGVLDGYGPIDAETARRLAADAPSFTRLLTHPESGAVLSVGRDSYRVPADLRRAVEVRDVTCTFVGCNRSALHCEIDHIDDWQYGGDTDFTTLQALCVAHHHLRHGTTWQTHVADDGTTVWTSPLGRHYVIRPYTESGTKRIVRFEPTDPDAAPADARANSSTLPEDPPF